MRMARRSTVPVVALAVILCGAVAAAAATVRKVPGDYATIGAALADSENGDTILVAAGVYTENLTPTGFDGLTLRGSGATIDAGTGVGIHATDCTGLTISGFTVTNATTGIRLENCIDTVISKCLVNLCNVAGILIEYGQDVLVTGCVLEDNRTAVRDITSTRLTVTKCRIARSSSFGVILSENGVGGGSEDAVVAKNQISDSGEVGVRAAGAGVRIDGNTIAGSGLYGIGIDPSGETGGVAIVKNRVSETTHSGISSTRDTRVEKNTVTGAGSYGIEVWGPGTIVGNKVSDSTAAGILVGGDGATLLKNKVSGAGWDGIWWNAANGLAESNQVKASGENGFYVTGSLNTFRKNSSSGVGVGFYDLWSSLLADQNVWESNRFETATFGGSKE